MLSPSRYFGLALMLFLPLSLGWSTTVDLDTCFQAALKQSEVIAAQNESIAQAEEHYAQALGTVYPSLYGYAAYLRQADSPGSNSNQPEQHQVKLGLTQPLFRGLREYAAIHQAGTLIHYQKEAKSWAAIQLYIDIAQTFYSVLALQKDIEHTDIQLVLYQKRIQDLAGRAAIGRSRASEVLTVQTALANLKVQRLQLLNQLQTVREMLVFQTGLQADAVLEDRAPWPTLSDTLDTCLKRIESRPDILAARRKVEVSHQALDVIRGEHWPNLDLTGNYYFDRSGSLSNVSWDAQLSLTLPIFSGFVTTSKGKEAESLARQSEWALQRLLRLAQQDVRTAYQTLESDLAQLTVMQEAAALSEKNYQAILHDYNYGLVTNLDVLQALSTYQDNLRSLDRLKSTVLSDAQRLAAVSAKFQPPQEGK